MAEVVRPLSWARVAGTVLQSRLGQAGKPGGRADPQASRSWMDPQKGLVITPGAPLWVRGECAQDRPEAGVPGGRAFSGRPTPHRHRCRGSALPSWLECSGRVPL